MPSLIQTYSLSGVARGHAPWSAGLEGAPVHFLQAFKTRLSKNFDQVCLKSVLFGKN